MNRPLRRQTLGMQSLWFQIPFVAVIVFALDLVIFSILDGFSTGALVQAGVAGVLFGIFWLVFMLIRRRQGK